MSTRATIKFSDGRDEIYVYRHCDGFPEIIEMDIEKAINEAKLRCSNPELGFLVTLFLSMNYDYEKERLPDYEITTCFHLDESYIYYCKFNKELKNWEIEHKNRNI